MTKSGTNQWHGGLLEYFRTGKLGARNYFNFAPDPKSPFNNNQFGGSFGGPIVKDKTFFYADYEGQRENGGQAGVTCVPDPAVIASSEAAIVGAWRHRESHHDRAAGAEPMANPEYRRRRQ